MTRPEPVRAGNYGLMNSLDMLLIFKDTFELQSHRVTTDDPFQMRHDDMGFDGLGEEEDDIYDEDNDDDDDGDALSSSPSIPDDVPSAFFFLTNANLFRISTLISCMLSIRSQPQSKVRQMPQKATCWSSWMTRIVIGGSSAWLKITV